MKKTVYAKYNRTRKPEYQTVTYIYENEGVKTVAKKALNEQAKLHVNRMKETYKALNNSYASICPVAVQTLEDGMLSFDYIQGKTLIRDSELTDISVDDLLDKLTYTMERILDFKQEYLGEFEQTEAFARLFGEFKLENEPAVRGTNIDCIIENFLEKDGVLYCIDYEWYVEYPVPIRYLQYRILFQFYHSHRAILEPKVSLDAYFEKLGFKKEDVVCFFEMEECFQKMVFGQNREYLYLSQYMKKSNDIIHTIQTIKNFENQVNAKDTHIINIEQTLQYMKELETQLRDVVTARETVIESLRNSLNQKDEQLTEQASNYANQAQQMQILIDDLQLHVYHLKRAIRNPFYGAYLIGKRVGRKILPYPIYRSLQIIHGDGWYYFWNKLKNREKNTTEYEKWILNKEKQEDYSKKFEYNPKVSVLVPVYNVLDSQLIACIESVREQIYENWELCLADDCSTWPSVRKVLEKYENDDRIKIVYREKNGHISRCTNSALEVSTGEFIALLDCDDVLRPNALYEVIKVLNEDPSLDFIYSDEDKIDDNGKHRHMPHFKPDWSPDTLMMQMYTCHFGVYRKSIAMEIGGERAGYEGAQDYDFTLRYTEQTSHIAHIPKILYHWRERKESTAVDVSAKPYILEAAQKTKIDALKRRGLVGELEFVEGVNQYRVNYKCQTNPLISIIIPSKDNYEILKQCLSSLHEKTKYENYEVIVVDNGSNKENKTKYQELCNQYDCEYHYQKMEFNFSMMCNMGRGFAKGEYLLFLNDDIEIIQAEWLERMLGQAALSHTGAVGAKLLYPNGNLIQHTGVINIENGPVHCFSGYDDSNMYYFARNKIDFNYLAVTAACLLVKASKFDEIQGFDEGLPVAYNDVDLCFSLVEHGYFNIVRNDVVLYHHESVSRGDDAASKTKMERLMKEQRKLYDKHPAFDKKDPFYNPNLAQNAPDFSYNYGAIQQTNHLEPISLSSYKEVEEGVINYSIDQVQSKDKIRVLGWAFLTSRRRYNSQKVGLLLIDANGIAYRGDTTKSYRPDVADSFGQPKKMNFVGFDGILNSEEIPAGRYQLGVMIGKYYVLTNRYVNG